MVKSFALSVIAITLLGACAGKPFTMPNVPAGVTRAYAKAFQDTPFERGEISVLAEEYGELHTYKLRPCGGDHICGVRQGTLVKAPDYYVVTDAYSGRIFYVSPGGDGYLKRDGSLYPIAWN